MISLMAEFRVSTENAEAFERAALELVDATCANEPGIVFYRLFRANEDAELFRFVEIYADQAAVDLHMKSAWLKEASQSFRTLAMARPKLEWSTSASR